MFERFIDKRQELSDCVDKFYAILKYRPLHIGYGNLAEIAEEAGLRREEALWWLYERRDQDLRELEVAIIQGESKQRDRASGQSCLWDDIDE